MLKKAFIHTYIHIYKSKLSICLHNIVGTSKSKRDPPSYLELKLYSTVSVLQSGHSEPKASP